MTDSAFPFAAIAALAGHDGEAVLVTVANARGSVPRDAGTTMAVGRDAVAGSIGGGHLEFEAIRLARAALAQGGAIVPWLVRFPLAARLGQCCGGVATLAFEGVAAGAPWLAACVAAERTGAPFAHVACLGREGHLAITAGGSWGSLGDAVLDTHAVAVASRQLASGEGVRLVEVVADERTRRPEIATDEGTRLIEVADDEHTRLAEIPDGERTRPADTAAHDRATLIVHGTRPCDFTVLVFGNGHVGRALVPMLAALPARVRWIDAREDDFPASVPDGVEVVATDIAESELTRAPRGACVVIATHDHALDFALVTAALVRDDWTYLGLIGSRSKRAQFERRLLVRGMPAAKLERIVCPIGRSEALSLRGKEPGTIALATAAEIVVAHDRARSALSGRHQATSVAPGHAGEQHGATPSRSPEATAIPASRAR